jgi:very-short-patch-repair endonuclease
MSIDELIGRISDLAKQQHGLVRLNQFAELEHRRIRHLDDRGIIERLATGVYRVSGSPQTWMQSLQAGVWALGKDVVVSHASAARLHGLDGFECDPSVEFTVARRQRNRDLCGLQATIHSTAVRVNGDLRRVAGLPVTSAERTIIDLARAGVASPLLESAIDSAIRLRLTTLDHVIERIDQVKGPARSGVARLDELVITSGGHSVLERRFLRLVRRAELPAPITQVVHRRDGQHVARVDFLFPEQNVVVEVSGGRGHSTASDRAKDARRRNELQQMGRTVLEFTYEDLMARERYVIDTLRTSGVSRS